MTVKNQRPKNLNLLTIHFPLPAIVSILHRISGVILFLVLPFALWGLKYSLASPLEFDHIRELFSLPLMKVLIWLVLSAFIYHFVAGIRHLLMDIHIGDELKSGRIAALLTIVISAVFILLAGIWLW